MYFEKLIILKKKYCEGDKVKTYAKEQIDAFKLFYPKMNDNGLILDAFSGFPKKIQTDLSDFRDCKVNDFLHFCSLFDSQPTEEHDNPNNDNECNLISP